MAPNLSRGIAAHPPWPRGRVPAVAPDVPNDWHAPVDQLYPDMEAVLCSDASSCQVRQGQWEVSFQRLPRRPGHGDCRVDDLLVDGRRRIADCKSQGGEVLHDVPKCGRLSMPLVRRRSPSAKRAAIRDSGETMAADWPRAGSSISLGGCPSIGGAL